MDYIAGELSKKLHSVCLYCKCRRSLLQAVRKGNFPDSHGRAISIHNTIFIAASTVCKGSGSLVSDESKMFSEERILEAKSCQMQKMSRTASEDEDAKTIGST